MNTPKWSPADQQRLDELQARRQEWFETNIKPVEEIVKVLYPEIADLPVQVREFAKAFIDKADAIRDALAPFDSGVRPAGPDI